MEKGLLIGNGINRGIGGVDWGNLLKNISVEYGVSYNEDIPMPLEFERIANEILSKEPSPAKKSIYLDIKKKIKSQIETVTLSGSAVHDMLPFVGVDCIMTTNYDSLIEQAFDPSYVYAGATNIKYAMHPTSAIGTVSFYHPHGITESTQSICLGYEHYMGQVQHLRDDINHKENNENSKMNIMRILRGEKGLAKDTWGERFYNTNIGILGLGLYESEADLWWLLTHRASLYYQDYNNEGRKLISNTIIFYDVIDNREPNFDGMNDAEIAEIKRSIASKKQTQINRHKLLEKSFVEVVLEVLTKESDTYTGAYLKFLDDFKNRTFKTSD